MNKELNRNATLLIAVAVTAFVIGMTWSALAQNPSADQPQSPNANKQKSVAPQVPSTKTPAKQDSKATEATPENPAEVTPPANATQEMQSTTPATTPSTTTRKPKRKGRMASSDTVATTAPAQSEQVDLSGAYSGVWNCPDAGISGDSTLTVNGNQFTLADGKSGRILATSTRGYTAVAMQFGEMPAATPAMGQTPATPPKIISLRARRSGSRLTLSPVSGGAQCSFMPTGSMARSRRTRTRKTEPPAAAGESTGNAASAPTVVDPTAGPAPEPSTPRKSRSKSSRTTNKKTNSNPENPNQNTGAGNANANTNPAPSPTPPPNR